MIKYKVIWMWSGGNNIIITPIPRGHVYSWILWKLRITSKAEFCGFIWLSRSRFWLNYDSYHRFFSLNNDYLSPGLSQTHPPTNIRFLYRFSAPTVFLLLGLYLLSSIPCLLCFIIMFTIKCLYLCYRHLNACFKL